MTTRHCCSTGLSILLCIALVAGADPGGRIMPDDLVYKGAFRLPDGPDEHAWGWSGQAMAYCPTGDAKGGDDGHPGSLFGTGHNWHQWLSEISIPKPAVPADKDVKKLPVAKTLQKFTDVRGKLFKRDMEQARAGLAYLPGRGKQTTAKLYFSFGPHMDEGSQQPSHGWCETDLAKANPAGPWRIGDITTYITTDYMLPIPKAWADKHAGGFALATGRFRDGGQGSQGPTLVALAPWLDGNPPAAGAKLRAKVLLRYSAITDDKQVKLKDYHHSDAWTGAAWMTAGKRSALVFVGTKGKGKCWYGFANGVVWPEQGPWPAVPPAPNDQRGWWSTKFVCEMLFYDPADLAAVAAGKKKPHDPQPYATLDFDKLRLSKVKRPLERTSAAAFDAARGCLYVFEPRADEDKSIVHVWKIRPPAPKRPAPKNTSAAPKDDGAAPTGAREDGEQASRLTPAAETPPGG